MKIAEFAELAADLPGLYSVWHNKQQIGRGKIS